MNTARTSTHLCLYGDPVPCEAWVHEGSVILTVKIGTSQIVLSGPPATVLAQLDAMRAEVARVCAEVEEVTG